MRTFSTTPNNEQADWERAESSPRIRDEKPSILESGPLTAQEPSTESAVLRLVGENQSSQSWREKWAVAVLCALSSILVYFILELVIFIIFLATSSQPTLPDQL
jgi:hypothetical protein